MPFAAPLTRAMNGDITALNPMSGRTINPLVRSGRMSARLFGVNCPRTMWRKAMTLNAVIAAAVVWTA